TSWRGAVCGWGILHRRHGDLSVDSAAASGPGSGSLSTYRRLARTYQGPSGRAARVCQGPGSGGGRAVVGLAVIQATICGSELAREGDFRASNTSAVVAPSRASSLPHSLYRSCIHNKSENPMSQIIT